MFSAVCGGNYFTNYGLIKSQNFPKKYATDLDCIYTIRVPNGQQISLNFTFFDLENSTDCAFDFVEIR
jgi:cubilin